jgi:hypothetical protein
MPYRSAAYCQPCRVCEALTEGRCRRCGAPICGAHARSFSFYVPAAECTEAADCRPAAASARLRLRDSAPATPDRDLPMFFSWTGPS